MKKESLFYNPTFSVFIQAFIVVCLGLCTIPIIGFVFSSIFKIAPNNLGDTIGGTMGPFVALFAALLTFLAFYVQYQANQSQRNDIKRERFETQYYEIIKLHRENVSEIKIRSDNGSIESRYAFVTMFNEFKFIYRFCYDTYFRMVERGKIEILDNEELIVKEKILNMSYILFFIGVGPNSFDLSFASASEKSKKLHKECYEELEKLKLKHVDNNYFSKFNFEKLGIEMVLQLKYKPFGGHMSRLGHYYRNLYMAIKYVDSQDFLSENEKYSYIKIIRAQLSNHEQALIYYNVISGFGWRWIEKEKNYLVKYRLIHNVPTTLLEFAIKPRDHKIIGEQIKEWEEVKNKNHKEDLNGWTPFFEWEE